jgi:hypothetical protein
MASNVRLIDRRGTVVDLEGGGCTNLAYSLWEEGLRNITKSVFPFH